MTAYHDEIDKTLFDFDDEIDNLSEVSERYKVQGFYIVEDPLASRTHQ